MKNLLGNNTPTVTFHRGHVQTNTRPRVFQQGAMDETTISEQSFADLSLISGNVSVQVVEGVKRSMK